MRRAALFACLGVACTLHGDGELASKPRELPLFTGIEVFDGFTATVTVDPTRDPDAPVDVIVGGDRNALGRLFTVVHEPGLLSAGVDPNQLTELSLGPTLTTVVPALRSGYVEDTSTLEVFGARGELALVVHESGSVMVHDGEALAVTATVIDDGVLTLAGSGPSLALVVEGAATVDAGALQVADVVVRARGTGSIRVCATATFKVYGSGADQVVLDCG